MTKPRESSLNATQVRTLLAYNAETGELRWRRYMSSRALAGSIAGRITDAGYRLVRINGIEYRASRLIWLIVTGMWPAYYVDHINRDRLDNRWGNLREATPQQNQRNRKAKYGEYKGVSRSGLRWRAQLFDGKKVQKLGYFDDIVEAARAYDAAARKHFGEFAYLNFPEAGGT